MTKQCHWWIKKNKGQLLFVADNCSSLKRIVFFSFSSKLSLALVQRTKKSYPDQIYRAAQKKITDAKFCIRIFQITANQLTIFCSYLHMNILDLRRQLTIPEVICDSDSVILKAIKSYPLSVFELLLAAILRIFHDRKYYFLLPYCLLPKKTKDSPCFGADY